MGKFLDIFLEQRMDSSDGEELKAALENTIAEEKKCLEQFELQIKICRGKIAEIDESLSDPAIATNSAKLNELSAERDVKQKELDELYEKWEELSAALEV